MVETNQGGEFLGAIAGMDPKLPFVELVELDRKRRRILIPKVVRRRLPPSLTADGQPLDLLCEFRKRRKLRFSNWASRGAELEADLRSSRSDDQDRLTIRSRFQRTALAADSRILLSQLAVAHLCDGLPTGAQLLGCFLDEYIEILPMAEWQDLYLHDIE